MASTTEQFLAQAEATIAAIRAELGREDRSPCERPSGGQLEVVLDKVQAMKHQVEEGTAPPRSARSSRLARILVDEWPLGHRLANRIIELENLYLTV